MSLDAWTLAELDRLAASLAHHHKRRAQPAYHLWAVAQGWHNTPLWIPARTAFWAAYRRHRQARRTTT